jgi:hypothetical protein
MSPQGDIYVSDGYGNSRVHKYAPNGKLLFSWGGPGTDPGEFNYRDRATAPSQEPRENVAVPFQSIGSRASPVSTLIVRPTTFWSMCLIAVTDLHLRPCSVDKWRFSFPLLPRPSNTSGPASCAGSE